jgi:hypothetical protein
MMFRDVGGAIKDNLKNNAVLAKENNSHVGLLRRIFCVSLVVVLFPFTLLICCIAAPMCRLFLGAGGAGVPFFLLQILWYGGNCSEVPAHKKSLPADKDDTTTAKVDVEIQVHKWKSVDLSPTEFNELMDSFKMDEVEPAIHFQNDAQCQDRGTQTLLEYDRFPPDDEFPESLNSFHRCGRSVAGSDFSSVEITSYPSLEDSYTANDSDEDFEESKDGEPLVQTEEFYNEAYDGKDHLSKNYLRDGSADT